MHYMNYTLLPCKARMHYAFIITVLYVRCIYTHDTTVYYYVLGRNNIYPGTLQYFVPGNYVR